MKTKQRHVVTFLWIYSLLGLTISGTFGTIACIHKSAGAVTPWEKVTTYNAVLAQTNNSVEQGAELAAAQNILPVNGARLVITYTAQVAAVHLQITAALAKGSQLTISDTSTISQLLQQIQQSGTALVSTGLIGVKNPKSQQTIAADVTSIVSVAQSIVDLLPVLLSTPAAPAQPTAQK
jgi:hypothetical protein